MRKRNNCVKIRTFIGFTDYVDEKVNEFIQNVVVKDIQTHATSKESITVTVIFEEAE